MALKTPAESIYAMRDWLNRPVKLKWVLVTYLGFFALGGYTHEIGATRDDDLCAVVQNVHTNAVFRYHTEQINFRQTREFLADPGTRRDSPSLYKRIKDSLPVTKDRVEVARRGAIATRVPPSCIR